MAKTDTKKPIDLSHDALSEMLNRRGHFAFNWDDIKPITLPNGVISKMYRIGCPKDPSSPTVFKVYYPPGCLIEAHTHECDYTEIILDGTQKVGAEWHGAGDVRLGLANRGYGPLLTGPEGASVLFIFKDGRWPAKTIGNNDGSTLHSDVIAESINQ
jgi:hypothetical protein|tara:strand:+ start:245 stop:715 length:471 start_codon:yes stop_codon:yes gene_type:complete